VNASACPVCHRSHPTEPPPPLFCPDCGADQRDPWKADDWVINGVNYRTVARRQRYLLWCVLILITSYCGGAWSQTVLLSATPASAHSLIAGAVGVVVLCSYLGILVLVVTLVVAMRTNVVLAVIVGILIFAPCINLLVLAFVDHSATRALKRLGLRVGFMGVSDAQVLRVLSRNRCKGCGYSLIGNVSGVCPECGRAVTL
jgi:hypothetical protein